MAEAPRSPAPQPYRSGAPNVLVIIFDDLGFAHLGGYGSDLETPTVDRLAGRGLRFTNFHTTAVCSPTRSCLLTGRNHHRVGMGMLPDLPTTFPGYASHFPTSAGTSCPAMSATPAPTGCGRPARASTATTGSSTAKRTSGRPIWCATPITSSRGARPRRATTLRQTWRTTPSPTSGSSACPTPIARSSSGTARGHRTRRTRRPTSGSSASGGGSTGAGTPGARRPTADSSTSASSPRARRCPPGHPGWRSGRRSTSPAAASTPA